MTSTVRFSVLPETIQEAFRNWLPDAKTNGTVRVSQMYPGQRVRLVEEEARPNEDYWPQKMRGVVVDIATGHRATPQGEGLAPGTAWLMLEYKWDKPLYAEVKVNQADMATLAPTEKMTLPAGAASLLFLYAKFNPTARSKFLSAWKAQFGADSLPVFQDFLLERALVKMSKSGSVTVTPRGKEIGYRIPDVYDPAYGHISRGFAAGQAHLAPGPDVYKRELLPLQLNGLYMRGRWMRSPGRY